MGARVALLFGALLLSGFAGLGYQVVWTRMLSTGLGHEVFAVLAVVAAFFAGLALGALVLGRPVARSARPGAWYAGLEVAIAAWTVGLIWIIPWANGALADMIGPDPSLAWHWAVAFFGPAILLLPATVAMGATLPASERLYAAIRQSDRGIGGLYAANAAGAMAGALATAIWLAPWLGFSGTLWVFAAVNLAAAAVTLIWLNAKAGIRPTPRLTEPTHNTKILAALFMTGLVGIGFEVAIIRALSQTLHNTVFSFAAVITIYLFATAVGAALWQRFGAPRPTGSATAALFLFVALACLTGAVGTLFIADISDWLYARSGPGTARGIGAELIAALILLGPAAAVMGALFPALAQAAREREGGLGPAFAANTAGAALAPFVVGVVLIPALGVVNTLFALSALYLVVGAPWIFGRPGRVVVLGAGALIAGAHATFMVLPIEKRLVVPPEGGAILAHREGVAASASVVEDARGDRHLRVNGTFTMGGTASYALDRIQGHTILLRHPAPERALFLGVGTGATLAAAEAHDDLHAEGVELVAETLDLVPMFPDVVADLNAAGPWIETVTADARRYVRSRPPGRYDVVIADNFHPAKDGSGLLYTVEHFEAVRTRLSEDGLFAQWLPLHQLDIATFRLIARTFQSVFPDAR